MDLQGKRFEEVGVGNVSTVLPLRGGDLLHLRHEEADPTLRPRPSGQTPGAGISVRLILLLSCVQERLVGQQESPLQAGQVLESFYDAADLDSTDTKLVKTEKTRVPSSQDRASRCLSPRYLQCPRDHTRLTRELLTEST